MPKLLNRPPKYSLHKPSGQAKVRYNGKTTYLGKHGTQASLEAYAQFVAKLPKPDGPVTFVDPLPGTILLVGECVKRFQEHARTYYARDGVPTGEHITVRCSLRPLVNRFDALPVTEFGPKRLKQVREDMIKLGWTRYYVNKATSITKRCFTWLASEELVPADVAVALSTVRGLQKNRTAAREKPPIGPVADEHVDATIPHVSDLVGDVVRVMRLTGMRPGEAIAMTAAEIDRSDSTCWVYRPGHHKTEHKDKTRAIFIGARAQEILLPYILKAADGPLLPITRAALRRAVSRGCERDNVPNWHPNQLRHTAATEFRSKFGLEAAQVLLGHSKADTTQVYAERDLKKAADVARKIG
jgi:integrase